MFFPLNSIEKILLEYDAKCVVALAVSNIRKPMLMDEY
jgi:hypothetical protein